MDPAPPAADRRADRALGVLVGLLVVLVAVRAQGGRAGLRPTDHHPPTVATNADLNRADRTELMEVPGIGPRLADAILAHRAAAPFDAVDDLGGVRGVGPATLDALRPWLSVEPAAPAGPPSLEKLERKSPAPTPQPPAPARGGKLRPGDPPLDVNAATEADLVRLPGVGPTLAGRIVVARGAERFKSPDDLRRVKGIGAKTLDNLRPFVVCRDPTPSPTR